MRARADYYSSHHQRARGHKTIGSHLKLSCELKLLQKAIVVYQEFILNSPVALYGSCLTGSICWLSLVVGNIF